MFQEFIDGLEDFIFEEQEMKKSDIIFLPGNGYSEMALKAAELYRTGMAPLVLPSGKFSKTAGRFVRQKDDGKSCEGSWNTEWEFLREILVRNGVPENAVLREDQATYTYENAIFSRKVTDRMALDITRAILCCKNYHAKRAKMYYQLLYPDTEILVCPVCADGITRENWRLSEKGITAVMGEVTRIVHQFSLMLERPDSQI